VIKIAPFRKFYTNLKAIEMKSIFTLMIMIMLSATAFSQTVIISETFPTNEFNNSGAVSMSGNYNGTLTGWALKSSTNSVIEVDDAPSGGATKALRFAAGSGSTNNPRVDTATSPSLTLTSNACTVSDIDFQFSWFVQTGETNNYEVSLQFSGDNGANWSTVWTNTVLPTNGSWNTVNVTGGIPNSNSYWTGSDFKFRFTARRSSGTGSREIWFDNIQIIATYSGANIPSFSSTPVLVQGVDLQPGAVYLYQNIVTSPETLDALIKIEVDSNAHVSVFDNNSQFAGRFQPKVASDGNLGSGAKTFDRGWVQFTITFIKDNSYQENNPANDADDVFTAQSLTGLRYQHYDVDGFVSGSGAGAGTFKEIGCMSAPQSVFINSPSDIQDGGYYSAGGYSWRKMLGQADEHTGLSTDLNVTFTASYGPVAVIRFRLGFELVKGNGSAVSVDREYGTEFTCVTYPQQATLPVKLLSFTGSYRNQSTMLSWQTENEQNFDHFEIERSTNGSVFSPIGYKQSANSANRQTYEYPDNLSAAVGNVFYYRLKIVDKDGQFKYSNVIMIRRESKGINGIVLNPNPVVNGMATVRFTSPASDVATFKIMDMSGKVVLQQQNKVYEGTNSVSINNLDRLQVGVYLIQMISGNEMTTIKFNIAK
jgi:hypothetical protein